MVTKKKATMNKTKTTASPRPKLHIKTTSTNCGTVLEWVHSLPRHMKTKKCKSTTKQVFMFIDDKKTLNAKATI